MPLPTDFAHCIDTTGELEVPLAHVDPFLALRFHFGMLLGVTDFEAQQAYHRGKSRLHNAWLHGPGVVWGMRVGIDRARNEVTVDPGLALDPSGHELYLDARACVDVGAWYGRHEQDADVMAAVDDTVADLRTFNAFVVARFRPCLTREVPALSEPCEGSGTETAFSRVAEAVQLDLRPGEPPPPVPPGYERTRIFMGLAPPRTDSGVTLPAHQTALDERARIAALPSGERAGATAAALHQFVALDAMDLMPAAAADGTRLYFPAPDDAPLVLATIEGIELQRQGSAWTLVNTPVLRFDRRPTLLPTNEIQHLALSATRRPAVARPRVVGWAITADDTIRLDADRPLDKATVESGTPFSVSSRAGAAAWTEHQITAVLAADNTTVTLTLAAGQALGATDLVRVIARGTGPAPILGTDEAPLTEFVAQQKRS